MVTVSIAVEGPSDVGAVEKILASRHIVANPKGIYVMRGKPNLDKKIASYNKAAAHSGWLVLRDSDRDGGDCASALREALLPAASQNPAFCLRLAVRSLEAWLLADAEAFAETFSVARSVVPTNVDHLPDPKGSLVELCRRSRRTDVRRMMTPPKGSIGRVGPEYVTGINEYARTAWRPDEAAAAASSLARALSEIDRLLESGIWH